MNRIMLNKRMQCPICPDQSYYWTTVEESAYPMHRITSKETNKKKFHLYKCRCCGHGSFNPGVKSQEELSTFYNQNYAQDYMPTELNERFLQRKKQYELDVRLVRKYLQARTVTVLDFGCSVGYYLKAMPAQWSKHGYEINPYEIEYLRQHQPQIAVYADISEIPKQKFDLITLRGVIEHLYDFKETFSLINKAIKKGGFVYISATPDFDAPTARMYGNKWNQICVPFHYHYFTSASLAALFAKNGFGMKGLHHEYLDTPYADFNEDSKRFIKNVSRVLKRQIPEKNLHAYPGTMLSAVFEKL